MTDDFTPKAIIVFAGARDSYQLAVALAENNLLEALVTDLYWPADQSWFRSSFGKLLSQDLVRSRYTSELDSNKVKSSFTAFSLATAMWFWPKLDLNARKDAALSRRARELAVATSSALFCYSYYAHDAFQIRENAAKFRFLFQVHPHPRTVRRLLLEEIERSPLARTSLKAEVEIACSEDEYEKLCRESELANGWVAASSFTARSLAENGVPADQIQIVPYGVDGTVFMPRAKPPVAGSPFTVVFVGSMTQRKGLADLLEAIRQIHSKYVRILLLGRGYIDRALLSHYRDLNVEYKIGLSREALIGELHKCDLFALPSLVEGFGHVILEAMSCGLPVLTTPNTCGPDVITQGVEGFLVPIRNPAAVAERIQWGLENRSQLGAMGESAALRAREFTWEKFRYGIRNAYCKMLAYPQATAAFS